jgi:hypothetical protein
MQNISPMNAAELLDKAIDVYKKSFRRQLAFTAVVYIIGGIALFSFVFGAIIIAAIVAGVAQSTGVDMSALTVVLIMLAALVFFIIWYSVISAGQMIISKRALLESTVRFRSMRLERIFFRVASAILAQAICCIPFVIGVVILIAGFFSVINVLSPAAVVFGIIFIVFIYIAVGFGFFAFSNIFALAVAVSVFEKKYFFKAVSRSWQLVKQDYWKILGLRIVWWLAAFAASFCGQGILIIINAVWEYIADVLGFGFIASHLFVPFTGYFGPLIIALIVSPLSAIMHAMIYINRRMEAEGFDIIHNLKNLESPL